MINPSTFQDYCEEFIDKALKYLYALGFNEHAVKDLKPKVLYDRIGQSGAVRACRAWLNFPSPFWSFTFHTIFDNYQWKCGRGSTMIIVLRSRAWDRVRHLPDVITLKSIGGGIEPKGLTAVWEQCVFPTLPPYYQLG